MDYIFGFTAPKCINSRQRLYRDQNEACPQCHLDSGASQDYVGGKISLVLQLIIEGKKTPVTFDFEVKSMKAIQPRMAPKGLRGG
jgi:hypothetical protein